MPGAYFATTFAFCFDMREGMFVFSVFQAFTALFWLASSSFALEPWPRSEGLRGTSIVLLLLSSVLGSTAVRLRSEKCALALTAAFSALVLSLTIDFGFNHPGACTSDAEANANAIGRLASRLLWTTDACLLMTILGWVTVGVVYTIAVYLLYMCVCFWKLLREASADARRVARALATLPTLKFRGKAATAMGEALLGGPDVGESCAICLSEYEEGEELRVLPCKHSFRRECIDAWISRQGISASCPLCKQIIVPSAAPPEEEPQPAARQRPGVPAPGRGTGSRRPRRSLPPWR
eukprot:Transcript_26994.p2 GENE.Transcript_26994~~Transcript_26994.p2  ORF type:complete len:294 (+),score=105.79 Transcript_26994:92-973(+)